MTLKDYFESSLNLFLSEKNLLNQNLDIAGRQVRIRFSSARLLAQFSPSIQHLETSEKRHEEITIYVGDSKSISNKLKIPPWNKDTFNAQGYANILEQKNYQIFFQPWIPQVSLYSRKHRIAIYWVNSENEIPWWEKTFSFRIIFHWWTRDLPAQLMHAGAVAKNKETGFLITGPSGAGKSTTCLNLVKNGYQYLGDDYIWLEQGNPDKIIALYQTAKLEAENLLERFPSWVPFLKNPDTYKKQKAIFDLKEMYPENWLSEASLKGILLPRVSGKRVSKIEKSKKMLSLMAIAPTTLHHLPHHRENSFKKISEIVSNTNTYNWELSTDKVENSNEFQKFLANEFSIN